MAEFGVSELMRFYFLLPSVFPITSCPPPYISSDRAAESQPRLLPNGGAAGGPPLTPEARHRALRPSIRGVTWAQLLPCWSSRLPASVTTSLRSWGWSG